MLAGMARADSTETGRAVALLLADEEQRRLLETLLAAFGYRVIRGEQDPGPGGWAAAGLYAAVVDDGCELPGELGKSCRGGLVILGERKQPSPDADGGQVIGLSRQAGPEELLAALRRLDPDAGEG